MRKKTPRSVLKDWLYYLLLAVGPLCVVLIITMFTRSCQQDPERITYKQDSRTGLCFAYSWAGTMAHVPCVRVLRHLEKE